MDEPITQTQEQEVLGETITPEPPPEQTAAPEVPPTTEASPAVPTEGEQKPTETPPVKTFSQQEVESLIQDRIQRVAKDIQEQNQKLQEEISSLKQPQRQHGFQDPNQRDLGEWFQDPRWSGWTLGKLREEQPDYYNVALGRIGAMEQVSRTIEADRKAAEERSRNESFDKEISTLKQNNPEYFDPYTGRPNDKFKSLYEWGAANGVYNLQHAHILMNRQTWESTLKKQAVDEYIASVTKGGGPMRAAVKDGSAPAKDIGSMNDTDLSEAYMRASNPQSLAAIEAELTKRGLL